jgi:shikimate 5-dehydrogenase
VGADNTDRAAARDLMRELGLAAGNRVAVVGAGGAALAVLAAVGDLGGAPVVFARREEPGRRVAARFGGTYGGSPEELDPAGVSLVVNATPLGRGSALPSSWGKRAWAGTGILDLAYDERPTGWAVLAVERGLAFRDGRLFLARQAVEQFARWTGTRPDPETFLGRIA